jgi:exopolysaccharide biosynthesis protein
VARASYPAPEPPDTGWRSLAAGIELREIDVVVDPERPAERLRIVRLDPSQVEFRVHYSPGDPRMISTWGAEAGSLLVVNGAYFAPPEEGGGTIGLLISDGQAWGTPLDSYAGMFAVTGSGDVSVRWLEQSPYDPQERLAQAVQSFPVLVKPGGVMGFPAEAGDGTPARRTVVAQDGDGKVLFIVAPRGTLGLHELAVFLAESDLEIDVALNLDGGGSTGLWLAAGDARVEIDSYTPVPSVISVRRR